MRPRRECRDDHRASAGERHRRQGGAVSRELYAQAIKWADRQTVVGMTAVYPFDSGEIVLRQRLKTPPPAMELTREEERGLPIPVDTRTFAQALRSALKGVIDL